MKKTISILLTLCMIVAMMPAAMAAKKATFKDVPEDMWCFDYVEYVAEEGYFKGTTTTTFEPNGPMTRQQFVVVLSRMVNAKVNNNQSPFSDVPAGSYSAGAIAWAAKHGITQGYEDGTFRPTEPITRQQMCAFMNRFMTYYANNYGVRYVSKNGKINFEDKADIAAYAKSAVDYCVKYGLILGYEDGTFRPTANATRAHVAAIIQRLDKITRKSSGGGGTPLVTYAITFTGDGSAQVSPNPQNLSVGSPLPVLTHTDIDGNGVIDLFNGWTLVGDTNPNVYTTLPAVTGASTMVANWTKQYTVTYQDADGNELTGDWAKVTYVEDSNISILKAQADTPTHLFAGWLEVAGANVSAGNNTKVWVPETANAFQITENTVLKATWTAKDDLLLAAVTDTVDYLNGPEVYGKYTNAQGVVQIDSITIDQLETAFTNTDRVIKASASATLGNDTVESLVETAVRSAINLVTGGADTADTYTYEEVKDIVIDVVEALGLTWTGKDVEALARQIYDQGYDAAEEIWDYFQANGDYIFDTADVIVNNSTLFSFTAATKSTSLGAKASAAALAEAIAKDLFQELKQYNSEANATTAVTMQSAVTLKFNGVPTIAQQYPKEYTLEVTLNLSNDLISFWYEDATQTSHLILTITQQMQDTYDATLLSAADKAMEKAEEVASEKMSELMDDYISGNATLDNLLDQMVRFGLYATPADAEAAVQALAQTAADKWVQENLSQNVTPNGATYYLPYDFFWNVGGQIEITGSDYALTVNGVDTGRTLFNNKVLTDEIVTWANGLVAQADIQAIMDDTLSDMLDPATKATYQNLVISEATTQLSSGTAAYLVTYLTDGLVNGTGRNLFKDMFLFDDVAALSAAPVADAIAGFDHALSYPCTQGSAEHLVKEVMANIVDDKVDDVFADVMASITDPMVSDLINSSTDIEAYVKALAMVELGFVNTYTADVNSNSAAALTAIEAFLTDYVNDAVTTYTAQIPATVDSMVVTLITPFEDYLVLLTAAQAVNTFDKAADVELSVLANILASNELQTVVAQANADDEIDKALDILATAIEKLPAKASITINGVLTISEAELEDIRVAAAAGDFEEVCDLTADMINQIGTLSLNNFDVPVAVKYGTRTFNCMLHIDID